MQVDNSQMRIQERLIENPELDALGIGVTVPGTGFEYIIQAFPVKGSYKLERLDNRPIKVMEICEMDIPEEEILQKCHKIAINDLVPYIKDLLGDKGIYFSGEIVDETRFTRD